MQLILHLVLYSQPPLIILQNHFVIFIHPFYLTHFILSAVCGANTQLTQGRYRQSPSTQGTHTITDSLIQSLQLTLIHIFRLQKETSALVENPCICGENIQTEIAQMGCEPVTSLRKQHQLLLCCLETVDRQKDRQIEQIDSSFHFPFNICVCVFFWGVVCVFYCYSLSFFSTVSFNLHHFLCGNGALVNGDLNRRENKRQKKKEKR